MEYPSSTEQFKENLINKYGGISFDSILTYAWDLGICVIPLNDSGSFHGASWNIDGDHVIILKQKVNYHSRWIFDLLHEIYHVFDHLNEENTSIIETEEISSYSVDTSVTEREANSFANYVLFEGKAEEYAQECIIQAHGQLENLQKAVPLISQRHNIREDSLANYLAFRLSHQGSQWWHVANTFQIDTPSPYSIARKVLKEKISLNKLNPIDTNLLLTAIEA
jgi:Zn-dependent peptidase ImmA (M78 family)